MNELNATLEREMIKMVMMKTDLHNVEELLEEKPINTDNMLIVIEQRESHWNQL